MDRRKFLKFMAVTPAAAAAGQVLANLPGVEPKIQLLEPKKIITDISIDTGDLSVRGIAIRSIRHMQIAAGQLLHPLETFTDEELVMCYVASVKALNAKLCNENPHPTKLPRF